jgi:predicted nuclease with TOPRIM domain
MLLKGADTIVRQQAVEMIEGSPSTLQKTCGHQLHAMESVRDLQARIEVKKEAMEEEQHELARRHAQLQSVVEAKMEEATELRGRLNHIVLAFECTLCFERLVKGSVLFGCAHTYCNRPTCGSCLVDTCPDCRLPVASRVQLFRALPDVGELLEKEPTAPNAEQVQRLASENAKASLEEIRKRSEKDKAAWQREREEMQQQVNRLREELLAAANANASLEEIRVQQNDQINKLLTSEKMRTKQVTPELHAERL